MVHLRCFYLLFDKNNFPEFQLLFCPQIPICSSAVEFFIHLFRSQANQPAAHLTSRSFICIFAELFSVYSSSLCISEDPHISLPLSLFLSSHSLVLRCVCHRCFYEMLTVNILPRLSLYYLTGLCPMSLRSA